MRRTLSCLLPPIAQECDARGDAMKYQSLEHIF